MLHEKFADEDKHINFEPGVEYKGHTWLCNDCKQQRHQCFVCGKYGNALPSFTSCVSKRTSYLPSSRSQSTPYKASVVQGKKDYTSIDSNKTNDTGRDPNIALKFHLSEYFKGSAAVKFASGNVVAQVVPLSYTIADSFAVCTRDTFLFFDGKL